MLINQKITTQVKECLTAEWEPLVEVLREELQEYGALLNLLIEQQSMIVNQESERILELNEIINQKIYANNAIRARRESIVSNIAVNKHITNTRSISQLLPVLPQKARGLLMALVEDLKRVLEKTQYKVRQNQMLLVRLSELTQRLLYSITPNPKIKTYNSGGVVKTSCCAEGSYMKATA